MIESNVESAREAGERGDCREWIEVASVVVLHNEGGELVGFFDIGSRLQLLECSLALRLRRGLRLLICLLVDGRLWRVRRRRLCRWPRGEQSLLGGHFGTRARARAEVEVEEEQVVGRDKHCF